MFNPGDLGLPEGVEPKIRRHVLLIPTYGNGQLVDTAKFPPENRIAVHNGFTEKQDEQALEDAPLGSQ